MPRVIHFLAHAFGHDGQRNQLRVRVFQRRARGISMVLENQNVAKSLVVLQVQHAVAQREQHVFDRLFAQPGKCRVVIRRLDDYFVRAHSVHAVKQSLARAVQISFDSQRRKFIRHHAHRPPRRVRAAAVAPVSKQFRRSLILVAVAERAKSLAANLHALAHEI